MGTIVAFPPPRRRRSAPAQPTADATILFFMGVRYVRDLEGAEPGVSAPEPEQDDDETLAPLEIA